jgi:hypothetical protein
VDLAKTFTVQADMEFDEHGKVVKKQTNELGLEDTIIVERETVATDAAPSALFEVEASGSKSKRGKRK